MVWDDATVTPLLGLGPQAGVAPEALLRRRLSWVAGLWVRSRVMVGNAADAEMVGTAVWVGGCCCWVMLVPGAEGEARWINWGGTVSERVMSLEVEPERSMQAAADVVDAIAAAAGASGWLCVPS